MLCCIPARYESTRLPGKPLLKINNKTIINLVYEKVKQTMITDIIVLTDDIRIYNEVINFGGKCAIINDYCLNGTDRIIKYLEKIDNSKYDTIINVQGDEPFINPELINKIIKNYYDKSVVCSTACYKTNDENEIVLKSKGKTIVDMNNNILYCSRNVIPTNKTDSIIKNHFYNIHIGVFVYNKNYLINEFIKENTPNQLLEDIEWLKIIEQGYKVNTIFTDKSERGVDTIDDYNYLYDKYNVN